MTKKRTCVRIAFNLVYCWFMNEIHIQILPSVSILFYETISLEECIFAVSMTIVWLSSTYSISKILKKKIDVWSLKLNHLTKFLTYTSEISNFQQRNTNFPFINFWNFKLPQARQKLRDSFWSTRTDDPTQRWISSVIA